MDVVARVRPYPGIGTRLLADTAEREDLAAYRLTGGYAEVTDVEDLLSQIDESGLRGRGGAAFPTGFKVRAVRNGRGTPVVVANGEEGEPASVKDRWLLRNRPHLVLDGLRLAALAVGTTEGVVYVSDTQSSASIELAIAELSGQLPGPELDLRVVVVDPTYVAGEETAAVQAINGGPALPMDKPPRPFEVGVGARPTLVSNVETLANLPLIQRLGFEDYRAVGTPTCPGTFLLTLSGAAEPGLYEVPFGITLVDVLTWAGTDSDGVVGALVGGYFAGVVGEEIMTIPLDYESLRTIGSGLGCGAIALLDPSTCVVDVSAAVMSYFARENAGQCGSCFNGTAAMSGVLQGLRDQTASLADVERLSAWSVNLRGRGACGTLDGATNIAATLLAKFPEAVDEHVAGRCTVCAVGPHVVDPPFAVGLAEH
ncbi:NADH-ubiquinone oxidoreductase-F iron-sulfur binding region domain-containing protein [Aeromicrobium yanjiei]|uniref:NADH-ubiquinone oxidoreductase-F iron-sulfur binding region domain-containing protein n=1 Tax=Aeromicrobium yanjiei TaxID=2662028 RepID=UPI001ABB583F|nr:NADH-ubiquinone oxidoreductase-F iron-sulfur binding region domain-containing protein [Aeromicrobium yanjiei]